MFSIFNMKDWYWQQADDSKIFSSAKAAYVAVDDAALAAWALQNAISPESPMTPAWVANAGDLLDTVKRLLPDNPECWPA